MNQLLIRAINAKKEKFRTPFLLPKIIVGENAYGNNHTFIAGAFNRRNSAIMSFLCIVTVVTPSFIYYGSQFGFDLMQMNILDNFFPFEIPGFEVQFYL
jgi:hypothetical protein